MYVPEHFAATDTAAMHRLIQAFPLGTLITLGAKGLAANPIPVVLDTCTGENGRLLAHVARNNAVCRDYDPELEALAVFQAAEAHITPNWHATKQETHEVVPTWKYAVVHGYGPLIVHDDAKWAPGQAGRHTQQQKAFQRTPWKMADAPPAYIAANLESIVGLEIPLNRLVGKIKASQNRREADREGAIDGLRQSGDAGDAAMAELMAAACGV
jgi:transcriptional regulator